MTKRIRQEDTKGNKKMIDIIKDGETVKVIKDLTPQQLAILNQKSDLKTHCSKLGGFINVCYVKNELLFNEFDLNRATISRLVFLATYIDYNNREENVLVKHGKDNKIEYLTRKDLKQLLRLSDDVLRLFLKEAKEKELLFENNEKYYLSNKIFSRGKCMFDKKGYARLFIGTIRFLYENSNTRQHKQLSYIFQLIPFLHYESNILCINPDETNMKNVVRLSLFDICKLLKIGTSKATMSKFEKNLLKFYIELNGEKYYLFKRVIIKGHIKNNDFFVVNPNVIWKGSDLTISRKSLEFLVFND